MNVKVLEGSEAVALAVKACRPQVISAYPISPQTHIVESLARMAADGDLDAQYVRVESEFSAASVISGASATGSRAYTASSSQGLLLTLISLLPSASMTQISEFPFRSHTNTSFVPSEDHRGQKVKVNL